ncbi:MAG TPA: hypothetical protein VKA44_06525, partial [Gemmatimonadota bacterium]|nr:hypothetical protein [Gemmatimonadota bacterium]
MARIASVRIASPPAGPPGGEGAAGSGAAGGGVAPSPVRRLAAALLAASPRVMVAGPDLCRVDARGWGRRGGEPAFARAKAGSPPRRP